MTFNYSSLLNSKDETLYKFLKNPFMEKPSLDEAISLSLKYSVPLHPHFLYYWNELEAAELINFLQFLKKHLKFKNKGSSFFLYLSASQKRTFEILGIQHKIKTISLDKAKSEDEVKILVIPETDSKNLLVNLGILDFQNLSINRIHEVIENLVKISEDNLDLKSNEILSRNSKIEIRDKGGTYIGARMGRPEKAKIRKLDGRPHGIFPIGDQGGRMKNIIEAYQKKGKVSNHFAIYFDETSNSETISPTNSNGSKNKKLYFDKYTQQQVTETHERAVRYKNFEVDLEKYVNEVRSLLNEISLPKIVKGVEGTINKNRVVEHLIKPFLRAKHDIYVNKDGTVRYDMIEMGITHFKPKEIETSIDKLKELGYTHDYLGNELIDENQLLEIFPQDVILPDCEKSSEEFASDYVIRTGNFVDELLQKLYNLEPFYNFKSKEDTIGHLIIGLAPHTSAGILGRIIGYSKTQGCFSHPVWHAAQRRNLDGDENGIMLLLDGLINFSREFLPDRRGSRTMDVSLVLTSRLYLDQIDDEVHGMDIVPYYPLEFYKLAKEFAHPKKIKIETIEKRISETDPLQRYRNYHFTHSNENLNNTILCSSYKFVPSMKEKLDLQLKLGEKIRAVDEHSVGSFVIDKHFMKDIKGNLRKFGMQTFRCTNCNAKYRRPPLIGKCVKCGAPSINFTISEGSVKKYLGPSFKIASEYNIDPYIVEVLELTQIRIDGVFGKELEKQKSLQDFFQR